MSTCSFSLLHVAMLLYVVVFLYVTMAMHIIREGLLSFELHALAQ